MSVRFSTLFGVFLVMLGALGLYSVKYKVQAVREQVTLASKALKDQRESLHIVEAEWNYLNRPQRLQQLSQRHLKLTPMTAKQMVDLANLPDSSTMLAAQAAPVTETKTDAPLQPASYSSAGTKGVRSSPLYVEGSSAVVPHAEQPINPDDDDAR